VSFTDVDRVWLAIVPRNEAAGLMVVSVATLMPVLARGGRDVAHVEGALPASRCGDVDRRLPGVTSGEVVAGGDDGIECRCDVDADFSLRSRTRSPSRIDTSRAELTRDTEVCVINGRGCGPPPLKRFTDSALASRSSTQALLGQTPSQRTTSGTIRCAN
jgi:hypothetical protein